MHAHVDVTADAVPGALALVHGARWRHASRQVGGEGPRCPRGPAKPLGWPALHSWVHTCLVAARLPLVVHGCFWLHLPGSRKWKNLDAVRTCAFNAANRDSVPREANRAVRVVLESKHGI